MEVLENTTLEKIYCDAHRAIEILDKARTEPVGLNLRGKCTALADMLYINIGEQLTVKRHFARDWGRGAFMDSIDAPLNDGRYIVGKLEKILTLGCRDEAFVVLENEILNRTNPGPGGFYDSMGDLESWRRFPDLRNYKKDPGVTGIVFRHFIYALNETRDDPLAWQKSAAVLYDTPMKIQYDDLDPDAEYSLKIKFSGIDYSSLTETVRMSINDENFSFDTYQVRQKNPLICFDLPKRITQRGTVIIILVRPHGGSITAVAEMFLTKRRKI
jgi:hypothetical protein